MCMPVAAHSAFLADASSLDCFTAPIVHLMRLLAAARSASLATPSSFSWLESDALFFKCAAASEAWACNFFNCCSSFSLSCLLRSSASSSSACKVEGSSEDHRGDEGRLSIFP